MGAVRVLVADANCKECGGEGAISEYVGAYESDGSSTHVRGLCRCVTAKWLRVADGPWGDPRVVWE